MTEQIKQTADRILQLLKTEPGADTAWQIKLKLNLSSSLLYMALGALAAGGKIELSQKDIDYKIILK